MLDTRAAAQAIGAMQAGPNQTFTGVTTDSRGVQPGELFVALRGERFDGHAFVDAALDAGAVAALVEQADAVTRANASLILVRDTRQSLGRLAAFWRARFTMPLVAVTGSNGKTTVKDMIAAVLRAAAGDAAVLATSGNLNNDIGVPLVLLRLREQHRYAVIEMGMNHLGEISYLTRLASPTVAVVNNAGVAHIGELGSRDAIARAKGEIYEGLGENGVALINADDEFAPFWRSLIRGRRVIDFGIDRPAAVSAQCELSAAGSLVSLRTPESEYVVRLQVPGLHNVRNALAAAAVAYAMNIPPERVAAGLAGYGGTKGRLQRKRARGGATLIDDTYNANPDSVKAAIAVLAACPGRRVLVLGDMGELGTEGVTLHAEVGERARQAGIDRLLTLGELSQAAAQAFGLGATHFRELDALCSALEELITGDAAAAEITVLIKGSRFMRMERVVERFINGAPEAAKGGH
jgi:UDP-N-acetylmuramoyl-tripeptide--D-alanyl-D-alanine ligase